MAALEGPAATISPRPRRGVLSAHLIVGVLVLGVLGAITLLPVLFVIVGSFDVQQSGDPRTFGLSAWGQILESNRTQTAVLNSFLLALRAPLSAIVAFFLAWLIIRTQLPARGFIEFALWVAFFLPALPVTLGWILLFDPSSGLVNAFLKQLGFAGSPLFNIYSLPGILWVHVTTTTVPVMVILLGPAIRQLDASLEESARVCGFSTFQIFRKITLPILAPAVLTGALAGFIRGLEAFEVEQILGPPAGIYVYSTRIFDLVSWEPPLFPEAMALSTFVLVILVAIVAVYQRSLEGRTFATLTGRGVSFRPLTAGRWRYVAATLLILLIALVLGIPVVMLLLGSFMKLFGYFNIADPFTTQHWERVWQDPVFLLSVRNSLVISFSSATLGVFLYALLAYLIVRSRVYGRRAIDLLAWLPWAIPGILLGIGLLWLVLATPGLALLYGSIVLIVLVLVVKDMPIGTHMVKSSIGQIALELEHSSKVCGADWFTTFRRIVLPLMRPMLVSIFVLLFISALRDISTTILLVTANTRPLSILLLEYSRSSARESAAVVGVVVTGMVIVVALVARRLGLQVTPPAAAA